MEILYVISFHMMYFLISIFLSANILASLKVVVISDLNGSYGSKEYHSSVGRSIHRIAEISPDLVLSTGDMIAGQKAGLDYSGMWDAFHRTVTTPLSHLGIPFAVTPGNHDGSGAWAFKAERVEFTAQWKKYKPNLDYLDDSHYPEFYSFILKDILFISLDATLVGELPKAQLDWLTTTLQTYSKIKHKVVFGHLPLFPVAELKTSEFLDDETLLKMLASNKVDLFLSGHHHAYYPGVIRGVRQISQGCLGSGPRRLLNQDQVSDRSLTVIEFLDNDEIVVDAFKGDRFNVPIPRSELPEKIEYQNRKLIRDDLVSP